MKYDQLLNTLKVYDNDKDKCTNDLVNKIEDFDIVNYKYNGLKAE